MLLGQVGPEARDDVLKLLISSLSYPSLHLCPDPPCSGTKVQTFGLGSGAQCVALGCLPR